MFPSQVVNGMVVPFGIFRMHLDQTMPGKDITYWQYLNGLFDQADQMRMNGASDEAVESYMLKELDSFRKSIREISLLEDFLVDLKSGFISNFDREMGKQPVFLRSDTNMEDLKDFTGAGLNLTVFNVVDYESILQGIRDVWASPYTERSYRWRQQYLLNPENVFPSILIIPSVDVECSGVMVTKGISNQEENDLTIAFNRGAGGAVDGQAAESYLLKNSGENLLISPAREPSYNRLPSTGGSVRHYTLFNEPVLNKENMDDLRILAEEIRKQLPHTPGIETSGPFDIELGFKDNNLWLFQVRPFVENKNAAASEYLNTLNPEYDRRMMIPLDQ
jgi:phosphoenolpyruvate synthase/pyruvate phosphate dikinase